MNLSNKIFFELTGPEWRAKLDAYTAQRQQCINAGNLWVQSNVCAAGRLARRVRGEPGVWVPNGSVLPKNAWRDDGPDEDGDGRFYSPRRNTKAGKEYAAGIDGLAMPPEAADFIKQHIPAASTFDFSEDGRWGIHAALGTLVGRWVLTLPQSKQNLDMTPLPGMVRIKASQVLALYEEQHEAEEAAPANG